MFERIDSWIFIPRALVSGFFYSVAFVCYVRSLSLEEASLVSPLYNFNIVFLAVIAFIFLGESLTLSKGLGLVLLLYGASHLNRSAAKRTSFVQSIRGLLHNTGCRFMMIASLLIAVGRVIDKSNIQAASPLVYCFFLYLIISGYVFVYVLIKGRTRGIVRIMQEQPWTAMASGAINAYSYLFLLVAITTIDVSVAEPVSMLGMVVTLLLSWLILGEDVRRRWFAVLVMLAGAWVMFV
jgi:transporter family protein